ncbi:toll/interleukin-1 receptor domain-containing protein [Vibrio cholerae]|uniref:toll/interleukin-1 receptor domain-containing protein n=1 Tax=Vibrio cholerae TaxID=666 RepID=UPI0018F0E954|nr:toll/interleukin-1 receptor domain-containing protein [Vibrio cholerae]MBJ6967055.1 toll/interleukin-1 receptor domain-containing protein [Vibrio cholerae]
MTTNQQPALPTREYLAFISYRHADNKQQGRQWATWLHQALETYEVPADLVGKPNSRGEIIPERIYPIFRDEDELPAHANLANSITDALTNSRLLVVLCSPNAVASTYVADEIQYFKKLGHSDRIIAAMIDGEPNASWDVAKQESGVSASAECFPLPLQFIVNEQGELTDQRAEPIAADFRVNIHGQMHQGWTNAEALRQHLKSSSSLSESEIKTIVASYQQQLQLMLLKIIAGVLGVPLGELTKRDQAYQLEQQRKRTKRLRQWLSAVGVLAVMAVGASVYAWQQRGEAIVQRDKADLKTQLAEEQREIAENREQRLLAYISTMEPVLESAFNLLFTNRTNTDDFAKVILGTYNNDDTKNKVISLIKNAVGKSINLDNEEVGYFLDILPNMNQEQLVKFIGILAMERKDTEDMEFRVRNEVFVINNQSRDFKFWTFLSEKDLRLDIERCMAGFLSKNDGFTMDGFKPLMLRYLMDNVGNEAKAVDFISCINGKAPKETYLSNVRKIHEVDKDIWWKISYHDLINRNGTNSYHLYDIKSENHLIEILLKYENDSVAAKKQILDSMVEGLNMSVDKKKENLLMIKNSSKEELDVLYSKILEFAFSQAQARFNKSKDEFLFTINNAIIL